MFRHVLEVNFSFLEVLNAFYKIEMMNNLRSN